MRATALSFLVSFRLTFISAKHSLDAAADDLALIDWLKKRVWPMEAAHSPESISASARLGIAELIKGAPHVR